MTNVPTLANLLAPSNLDPLMLLLDDPDQWIARSRRKSDGKKGSLEFQHSPRIYFNFSPHEGCRRLPCPAQEIALAGPFRFQAFTGLVVHSVVKETTMLKNCRFVFSLLLG